MEDEEPPMTIRCAELPEESMAEQEMRGEQLRVADLTSGEAEASGVAREQLFRGRSLEFGERRSIDPKDVADVDETQPVGLHENPIHGGFAQESSGHKVKVLHDRTPRV